MATQPKSAMHPVRTLGGTGLPVIRQPEGITTTFKRGALCVNTAGFLVECGADPALILGLATRDAQNGAANGTYSQEVWLAHPDVLFEGYMDSSGGEGTGVSAATDRLKAYGVAKSASGGIWYVDSNDATNDRVTIWEFVDNGTNAIGDIRTHVIFSFLYANFQGNIGT